MIVEIIIPTIPGREKYLHWALKSCMSDESNVTVLVSSNGGGSGIRDVVNSFRSNRIRLVESETFLPMALHWEFACSHAIGDVVSIIGDDDAIVPGAIQKVIDLFDIYPLSECITHSPAHYYWPDYPVKYCSNKFTNPQCTGGVEEVNPNDVLKNVIEMKEWYGRLPYLYHGFVKRDVLERIRLSEGAIFKRIAPDIYSDFVLALHINSYLRTSYCLTVGGQGAKSTGANFILNTKVGKEFLKNLPEELKPKLSGKSINLQVFEYSRIFSERIFGAEEINTRWIIFVLKTLIEAATKAENEEEIVSDLHKILKSEMPPIKLFFYRLLIKSIRNVKVTKIITKLYYVRHVRLIKNWHDGSDIHANNVFDVAKKMQQNNEA